MFEDDDCEQPEHLNTKGEFDGLMNIVDNVLVFLAVIVALPPCIHLILGSNIETILRL